MTGEPDHVAQLRTSTAHTVLFALAIGSKARGCPPSGSRGAGWERRAASRGRPMTLDLAAIARAFDRSANVKPGATSISVACPLCGYNASSCTITIKCGRLLVHCHAGCDQRRLFAAVVEMARLGCERPACWQRPAAARAPMSLQEDLAAEGERLPFFAAVQAAGSIRQSTSLITRSRDATSRAVGV